jgi:hypothetical protein
MGNAANEWAKRRRRTLLRERGSCESRGCSKPIRYMAHVRETPLSRTGPRGRKERLAEYARYPNHFRGLCAKHYSTDKKARHHDSIMRKKGSR